MSIPPQQLVRLMLGALLATIAAIAYAGLAPLDFQPANGVEWLDPGPGLRFDGRGIAYSSASLRWDRSAHPSEVSVELWVIPAGEPDDRLGQMFAFFDGTATAPLLIGQWKSGLVVRTRVADDRGRRRHRELGSLGLLFRDQERFITVTSAATGSAVYLDGRQLEERTNIPLASSGEEFGGRIVLGNSATGTAPWRGKLLGVAVYRRALAPEEVVEHHERVRNEGMSSLAEDAGLMALYTFEGRAGKAADSRLEVGPSLQVPLRFERLRTRTLQLPNWRSQRLGVFSRDVLLNLFAFTPLGFLAVAVGRERSGGAATRNVVLRAVLLGGVLSLGIELIQVELPARVSSALDLICNLTGTAAGAALAWRGPLAARLPIRGRRIDVNAQ